MTLLLGAFTLGLILALLALGVYVSYRIFNIPDLTAEGSVTLGASVAASLMIHGQNAVFATGAATAAGAIAGCVTGLLATKCRINPLLSGILVMTGLYSVNLHVMGKSNVPLLEVKTLASSIEHWGNQFFGAADIDLAGWAVSVRDVSILLGVLLFIVVVCCLLYWFLRTHMGTAMRATGDSPDMIRALGVSVDWATVIGLAISNALIALCGALLAQYQGFADVQMGIGMVVLGIASVIIGEALVGSRAVGLLITGTVMGSVLFRLLVAIALRWGLSPNDLKLITAVFVFAALVLPNLAGRLKTVQARRRVLAKVS
ncbi:ABC transporter permease [Acidobacteria bacterium AB60]|nr:ABC transporter permease [Acidobacteria bacterium AB60]